MAWWKQTALAALAIIVAAVGFARFYPGAPDLLSGLGASPALVSLAVGNGSAPDNSGQPRQGQGGPGGGGAGGPPRETLVETAEVGFATINDKITAIGDGEAQRSVTVVPLADGVIGEISVKSGDKVSAGDVLARLESEKEVIARDRAALSVKSLEEKVQRTERLASSRAASEVALSDARSELETAKLALRDAELVLQRRAITVPFDGIVGIVNTEIGQFVTTQTQIATIDDRSSLLIDFWVPERFSAAIVTGQKVDAQPIALPGTV
ncbi:MAG TPA: efflux RND transporter periplasmic adaptor subunit, partial [Rhizobiaceae bacterium]|nr:efflux RND transporter periplasmic adaptor subunit [Rhizobiaceae bacterium]